MEQFEEENGARYQLLFDKILTLLKMPELPRPKDLFRALKWAVESFKYLSDDAVRHFFLEKVMALIDSGITFGYQILASCLNQIYEDLESYMEIIIAGISKTNGESNEVDEGGVPDILNEFWTRLCHEEVDREDAIESCSEFEISVPTQYLRLLRRYGDRIVIELSKLFAREACSPYVICSILKYFLTGIR